MTIQNHGSVVPPPRIVARACGGWMAFSPAWARFSIAVTADTEEEARQRFEVTFSRWVSIVDDTVFEST
jgi:hypothetical protein